jgi:hypothetical protein
MRMPFTQYAPPVLYGPTTVELVKTDNGYAIGWSPISYWGGPFIEGAANHIAKEAFFIFTKLSSEETDADSFGIFGTLIINFSHETTCFIRGDVEIREGVDKELFLQEVIQELDRLKVFLPFA